MSKIAFGGITFGPWLCEVCAVPPVYVSVAVEERFFQTIFGSWPSVFALASTISVFKPGVPSAAAAGTLPAFQVIVPPEIDAVPEPFAGVTCVNVVPSGAGMVTVAPLAEFAV